MTDHEILEEIAKQIRATFALLAANLRAQAKHHGPVHAKTLNLTADEIDKLPGSPL